MIGNRLYSLVLVLACFALACVPGFGSAPVAPKWKTPHTFTGNMKTARMEMARQNAMASRLGRTARRDDSPVEGWSPKYTRYVGCLNSPAEKTFTTLQAAFVGNVYIGPIQPYTQVKVCSGFYPGGNVLTTSYVAIVGQGSSGSATVDCAYGTLSNGLDGIAVFGSNDQVDNLSVNNCYAGVDINYEFVSGGQSGVSGPQVVVHNEVHHSFFTGNNVGVYSENADHTEVENNEVQGSYFAGVENQYDTSDAISGNEIIGSGVTGGPDSTLGILVEQSIETSVHNNQVSNNEYGFGSDRTEFSDISHNSFNGNGFGVYLAYNDSGAEVAHVTADGNVEVGIYAGASSGANAYTGQIPNRFLYNRAYGNGIDYYDATFPSPNYNPGTDHGTANYWHANEGKSANPPGIVLH